MTEHGRGVALCLLAGTAFSLGGVLVRAAGGLDPWAINLYRSLAIVAAMGAAIAWRYGRGLIAAFRAVGGAGLLASVLMAGALICFVFAVSHATVAHALFIMTTRPLFAALLAWAFLGERVRPATWAAIVLSATGVAVMVAGDPGAATGLGSLAALCGAFCIGGFAVAARAGRGRDLLPSAALSAAIVVPISLMAGGGAAAVGVRELAVCAVMGVVQTTLGMLLYIAGTKRLPAAETVLLGLVEVVLAPLWVLLVFAEVPGTATLTGGALVLAAVLGQGIAGARAAARAAA